MCFFFTFFFPPFYISLLMLNICNTMKNNQPPQAAPHANHDSTAPRQHPLICTGAKPIHQVHGQPMSRAPESDLLDWVWLQSWESSIMERGNPWIPKEQEGNTQDIWTRAPHNLPSGCTDPKKKEKLCKKRTPTGVSPILDLYYHGPESKKRLQRSTICIFGSDSTPLGFLSQSYTNALPSFQTDGLRHLQGNRRPSLNHPGTDSYRDHISVYEYLPIHGRQSYGTNRHVDHDGKLDKQTKEQPNYNAGGPKLCTPGVPMGLRTTY